jgi:four helix bundle protein
METGFNPIRSFMDLEVYRLAHKLAMDIFWISAGFPVEERYSLTDQIRRSSRSVAANIAEEISAFFQKTIGRCQWVS